MENAAITPLFEKLKDENLEVPFERKPKQFLSLVELQDSIMEDLSRLLNTRVAVLWQDFIGRTTMPFSYGVNVTCVISAENVFEVQLLESRIDSVIKRFEPRLIDAKSHVVSVGTDPSTVFITIDADVIIDNRRTPLSFPIVVDV